MNPTQQQPKITYLPYIEPKRSTVLARNFGSVGKRSRGMNASHNRSAIGWK